MSGQKIVRLNASALYALGMDRPTVEALINSIRVTGNDSTSPTVPGLAGQIGSYDAAISDLKASILAIQVTGGLIDLAPVPVESISTSDESWKLAPPRYEQVVKEQAVVDDSWNLNPVATQQIMVERVESLESEVRQMSEQVAVLIKMFQDDLNPRGNTAWQEQQFLVTETRQLAEKQTQIMTFIEEIKQGTML